MTTSHELAHLILKLVAEHKHGVGYISITLLASGSWEFVIVTKPPLESAEEKPNVLIEGTMQ